jgi:hypothetical protein
MEALVVVFIDMLCACLVPLAHLAAMVVSAVATLLVQGVGGLLAWWLGRGRVADPVAPAPTAPSPWRRRLAMGAVCIAGLLLVALVVIECGVDRIIVRQALDRIAERGGPRITADALEVTTCTGRVALSGVRIAMPAAGRTTGDVTLRSLDVDADLWSLLTGEPRCTTVAVVGLRGSLAHRLAGGGSSLDLGPIRVAMDDGGVRLAWRQQSRFCIDLLTVEDADLDVRLEGTRAIGGRLTIERSATTELGSRSLLSAILLRTSGAGTWLGASVRAETGETPGGRRTTWTVAGLPATALGVHLGTPWDCLAGGQVDVAIADRWSLGDDRVIDMDWRLTGRDLVIAAPTGAGRFSTVVATALAALTAADHGRLDLSATVRIDRDRFEAGLSGDLAGLGLVMTDALLERILPDPADRAAVRNAAAKAAKAILDHWRRH